ncbi:MAG: DEAD/DEAH box helicase [Pseudomonadota bacterium]|nr:DEAD/DEAH box helicase [Pseudomonadota bacterium]
MNDSSNERDPFLFDIEQLRTLAPEHVVGEGLAHFQADSVTDLDWGGDSLRAQVEDLKTEDTLLTGISFDEEGNIDTVCDCSDESPVCRHAIAVLYAYAEASTEDEGLRGALDAAIEERVKSGRNEVEVKPVGGDAGYGPWSARSIGANSRFPRSYRVHIRSLTRRSNYCTCPDFAGNQLGTCKHIEAVLNKLGKRRDYARLKRRGALLPYVYLDWNVENAPRIALHRAAEMPGDGDLAAILQEYFNDRGVFQGRLPDEFFRFAEQVEDREDIDLGEDAVAHAKQLSDEASHQLRSAEIRQSIVASGGRLPGIRAKLYPYQVEGVAFLAANGRALLADDMGLGKTLQAIAAAGWLHQNANAERVLIICPASLKHQWAREIEKFTEIDAQIIQGNAEARGVQYRRRNAFTIINYELVLRDLSVINELYTPDLLILDEAQRIKNWRTQIATAIKLIPSRYAFVLTGTPLENRLEDLYSLMQVVDSRVLGPLWRYMIDFHITDERGKVLGYRNLSILRRRLEPVMLRRDRRLVSDQLPERIQTRVDLPMTEPQQELHDNAMNAAGRLATIAKRRPLTPGEKNRLMAALQQARMACDAARLVDKESEGSPKIDELEKVLDDLCLQGGRKAVVFSQWTMMTEMVEQRLREMGLGSVRLHGGVPTAKRGALMDRFRDDDAIQVFISTDAGGVGLNLQNASVLINLDVPWNPAVLEQRIARIHRLGQSEKVQVILMVTSEGYEGRVMELVQNKQNLFDNVISEDAEEDVVGVSAKLLESVLEDLAAESPDKRDPVDGGQPELVDEELLDPSASESSPQSSDHAESGNAARDAAITQCIESLQQRLGARIERIMGAGGGLMVVVDRVDEEAWRYSLELSETADIQVALVDPISLSSMRRLGLVSEDQKEGLYYDAAQSEDVDTASPLMRFATERIEAAEVLLQQDTCGPALELLASAMVAAVAGRGELTLAPAVDQAGIWIYSEALPKGWIDATQAALVMRTLALLNAVSVPAEQLQELLAAARGLVIE